MTVLSSRQACARLGIDGKTLRRWLAQAQLSLEAHPTDGRLKGVPEEHLRLLARLHQRCLADEPPASGTQELLGPLAALPETLAALSAHLAALQQQVTALTQLLLPPPPAPSAPPPSAVSAPTSSPAPAPAQPTRPAVAVLPRVEVSQQGHYVLLSATQGVLPVEPDSPAWFGWLAEQQAFRFVGKEGHFTAHRERERVPNAAWRAHRRMRNHTYNQRLGQSEQLSIAVLEQAAASLQAHLR